MKYSAVFSLILLFPLAAPAPQARSAPPATPAEVGDRLVDLKKCIAYLDKTGNLVRVKSEVDAKYELAGIAKKYEGKKCVLFEKVKGSKFPVLMGLLWNRDTVGSLFNVPKENVLFAEVTGYYGKEDKRWVMRVKAITHQKNPIFHSVLSGQEVWNAVGFTAEAKIFVTVNQKVPDLKAVYLPPGGCGFYKAVIQLDKSKEGIQDEAIRETFKAFPSLQWVVAVDKDVNIHDPVDVDWAITTRFNAKKGFITLPDQPGHILNPMVEGGLVTKIGGWMPRRPIPAPPRLSACSSRT